jgi:hypothetical protein
MKVEECVVNSWENAVGLGKRFTSSMIYVFDSSVEFPFSTNSTVVLVFCSLCARMVFSTPSTTVSEELSGKLRIIQFISSSFIFQLQR